MSSVALRLYVVTAIFTSGGGGGRGGGGGGVEGERCRVCSFTTPSQPLFGDGGGGSGGGGSEGGGGGGEEEKEEAHKEEHHHEEEVAVRRWFDGIRERCEASGGVWSQPELTTELRPIGHVAL